MDYVLQKPLPLPHFVNTVVINKQINIVSFSVGWRCPKEVHTQENYFAVSFVVVVVVFNLLLLMSWEKI